MRVLRCISTISRHDNILWLIRFSRPKSREEKKNHIGIIIIIFYDVPTIRVIREISISANCRLIVSPASPPATVLPRTNNPVRSKTHFDPSEGFVTVSRITTKTFSVTFWAIINIKTKILNRPDRHTYTHIHTHKLIHKYLYVKYCDGIIPKNNVVYNIILWVLLVSMKRKLGSSHQRVLYIVLF